jgi:hypothetical protein
VSFWHPLLVSSWRRRDQARPGLIEPLIRQRRWQKRTRRRGERGISRKTIARGMPGLLRCICGDYARVSISLHTRLRAHRAPGIPCALCYLGERFCKTSGDQRRGNAKLRLLAVIARSEAMLSLIASEAIHSQSNGNNGLLRRFAPRNDGLGIGCLKIESISSSRTSEPTGRAYARPMTGSASAIRDP